MLTKAQSNKLREIIPYAIIRDMENEIDEKLLANSNSKKVTNCVLKSKYISEDIDIKSLKLRVLKLLDKMDSI